MDTTNNQTPFKRVPLNSDGTPFDELEIRPLVKPAGFSYRPTEETQKALLRFQAKLNTLSIGELNRVLASCYELEDRAKQHWMLRQSITFLTDSSRSRRLYEISRRRSKNFVASTTKKAKTQKQQSKTSLDALADLLLSNKISVEQLKEMLARKK